MTPEQITANHRSRLAYVYVRQSCQHQVLHHQESQRRQRGLVQRAHALGWPQEHVILVDEDLGQSAAQSQERSGFQRMVAQAALGKVGLILALEVSRLSRGNRDWYHLLDICAVTWTLLADGEGLYDPRAYNDRLLLGLKGTMSEASCASGCRRDTSGMKPAGWSKIPTIRSAPRSILSSSVSRTWAQSIRLTCPWSKRGSDFPR